MDRPPVVSDAPSREDLDLLERLVDEHNFAATGRRDGRRLAVFLRDDEGRLVAGLAGHTWGGACEIRLLWVAAARRGAGLGSRLLRAAEDEARARGCRKVVLLTHGFQAPGFYRRHGYAVAGEVADYPLGHAWFLFERSLEKEGGTP